MPGRRVTNFASLLALAPCWAACASIETDAESSVAADFRDHRYARLCVSTPEKDLRLRRAVEAALAEELTKAGVEVVQLGELLFPGSEHGEEEVRRTVQQSGADGFLVLTPLETWTDERYVPPSISTTAHYGRSGHPYGWGYATTWYSGGYTVSRPRATFDVRLIDVATEEVAWVASVGASGSGDTTWTDLRRAAAREAARTLVADGLAGTAVPD